MTLIDKSLRCNLLAYIGNVHNYIILRFFFIEIPEFKNGKVASETFSCPCVNYKAV